MEIYQENISPKIIREIDDSPEITTDQDPYKIIREPERNAPMTDNDFTQIAEWSRDFEDGNLSEKEQAMYSMLLKAYHLAFHDTLTGLQNRMRFNHEANKEHMRNPQNRESGVLVIDINDFKQFNTQYGHNGGDEVIRHIARIIAEEVRDHDIPIRYAGDEFCIIANNLNNEGLEIMAERLFDAVASQPVEIQTKAGESVMVSVSISLGGAYVVDGIKHAFELADDTLLNSAKAKKTTGEKTFAIALPE